MTLIVQKFGGSSVKDIASIKHVARVVTETHNQGHCVVVVVSAMGKETDRLEGLAKAMVDVSQPREMDVLLATGEQVTIALLAMALNDMGCPATSYTGAQVPILTDDAHTRARILDIDDHKMRSELAQGRVVVVAGFQGVDAHGHLTTLGRGGSDTTAVALAAALGADECQIFTDVDGVYTTDPRVVPNARRMSRVTFEEMLELSSLGAKVLQIRSVEFAGKYNVPLRVKSTFQPGPGTLITFEEKDMEEPVVSGIAFSRDEAKLIVHGIPEIAGIQGKVLGPISDANIEVDMIVQNQGAQGLMDFAFTVHRRDYLKALEILNKTSSALGAKDISGDDNIAKISLVGVGMRSHAGIASTMFQVFGEEGINIQLVSTSEIKVSVILDEKYLELGVRALHTAFKLHETPAEESKVA